MFIPDQNVFKSVRTLRSHLLFSLMIFLVGVVNCFGALPRPEASNYLPDERVHGRVSEKCTHVRILSEADAELVEEQFRGSIIDPGTKQKEALRLALDALPPLVCGSVRKVVFVNAVLPSAPEALAWVGRSRPDLIVVSAVPGGASESRLGYDLQKLPAAGRANHVRVWPEVIHSVIHEAYHCATHLLESFGPEYSGPRTVWPESVRSSAERYVDSAKLRGGFLREWERVNREFASADLGTSYDKDRTGRLQPPPKGLMTIYAGASAGEDIAETASWAVAKPLLGRKYSGYTPNISEWKYACSALEEYREIGIPAKLAAIYTKLSFLRDVGFITDDNIMACQGSGSIGLIGSGQANGIRFYSNSNWRELSSYTTDLKTVRSGSTFGISAWGQLPVGGQRRRTLIEVSFAADQNELPRGIYRITQCNSFLPPGHIPFASKAQFKRTVEGVRSQSICAFLGWALVTRATEQHIEGSIFVEKVWKFSAPPVPEVSGLPVHVIFSVKR